jgi:transcription initiation factor TFIIE subunit alpha
MQIKLLKKLVEKMAGENAIQIVDILHNKSDVNEFLIAKKMNMTVNQVRNILYKLSAEGLVSFTRKKDKRKGWYIYFWTLNILKCLTKIEQEMISEIQELKKSLESRQAKRFYLCKTCNIEATEEKALEEEFSCPECAEIYELVDNTASIKDLTNKIHRRERDLIHVQKEISNLRELEKIRREKLERKEEKLKQAKKDEKKKLRKLERDKKKEGIKKTKGKKLIKKISKKTSSLKKNIKKKSKKKKA